MKITNFNVYKKDENNKYKHVGVLKKYDDKTGEWRNLDAYSGKR